MCLPNGEMLWNGNTDGLLSQKTVSRSLKDRSFKGFYAPVGKRNLSFNKRCRLPHVKLEAGGISTKGHVWKLGRLIQSHDMDEQSLWVDNPTGVLDLHERKRLIQLAKVLRSFQHFPLEKEIRKYLHLDSLGDANRRFLYEIFAESYMRTMASELVNAIDQGTSLRLGCLWDPSGRKSPYRAISIWDHDDEEERAYENSYELSASDGKDSALSFTASRPETQVPDEHDANDVDRHVPIEVERMGFSRDVDDAAPRLRIKRWRLGLCFFEGWSRTDVVPWPPGLETIWIHGHNNATYNPLPKADQLFHVQLSEVAPSTIPAYHPSPSEYSTTADNIASNQILFLYLRGKIPSSGTK
ncbi:hypothetical protein C2857_000929 [Epichloe festucae Fl1]|uniref:Uncharacterized protein n=1 Tax=Epichloe festucae (strain Fl1) TaxID=877507 RepID=A0A7S9PRQ4_EPIFF|nr:hypothetical protein C2857_000929 [Epichloe festucae Fl1]